MKELIKRIRTDHRVIAGVCVAVLFLFTAFRYGFWYASSDDPTIASILSGEYSGSADLHTVYTSPALGAVLKGLSHLIPTVPWFGVLLILSQYYGLWLCAGRISGCFKKTLGKVCSCAIFLICVFGLLCYEFVFFQYTMAAGMLAGMGIFLLLTEPLNDDGSLNLRQLSNPFVLYVLAVLLREDAALLQLPFLGLALVYKVLWQRRTEKPERKWLIYLIFVTMLMGVGAVLHNMWLEIICIGMWVVFLVSRLAGSFNTHKKLLFKLVIFVGALGSVIVVNSIISSVIYGSSRWNEYTQFNAQRTKMYDYSMVPIYDDYETVYRELGMTREDYNLMYQYNFAFSDQLNATSLTELLERTQTERVHVENDLKRSVLNSIQKFYKNPTYPQDAVLIALALASVIVLVLAGDWINLLMLELIVYGHIVCWGYLYWINRMPGRVTQGIYVAEILLLLGICVIKTPHIRVKQQSMVSVAGMAAALLLGMGLCRNVSDFETQYKQTMEQNMKWDACEAYCENNPDTFYFMDTISVATVGFVYDIFDDGGENIQNYNFSGSWITNSPLYYEKIAHFGIDGTVQQHMENGGEIHYICNANYDQDMIYSYFVKPGYTVKLQKVDDIDVNGEVVYTVYRVVLEPTS